MKTGGQRFRVLPGQYAVCRLSPDAAVPAWAAGPFVNITFTDDELAIICPAERVPAEVRAERDWRVLKLVGPFPFTATGVLASLATPLARSGISLLSIATYDTDYFLVKKDVFEDAAKVLIAAGHTRLG
ncbi:ACT domain-containing protein [Opitutus sp. ER46]|uniref:ACT domain-containing protein n=1 Tax=Opitutus sp. ER46 TaxID=2161864 RepID=UPI000D312F35|nr:ACT domain-containing protein [Opitutus sp. ER46]PTX92647.1 ACT domain-containing protein [Opitutus sp. ER46]